MMPTGWRPADVAEKYPTYKITDVYRFEKYDPRSSRALITWSWIQMIITLLLISYFFGNIATINKLDSSYIYVYALFIFFTVYAYTDLMDRNKYAIAWEIIRGLFGIGIIYYTGDWFGMSQWQTSLKYILIGYFIFSMILTAWFSYQHYKEDQLRVTVSI